MDWQAFRKVVQFSCSCGKLHHGGYGRTNNKCLDTGFEGFLLSKVICFPSKSLLLHPTDLLHLLPPTCHLHPPDQPLQIAVKPPSRRKNRSPLASPLAPPPRFASTVKTIKVQAKATKAVDKERSVPGPRGRTRRARIFEQTSPAEPQKI